METSNLFDDTQLRRKALLTPCGSKEGLRRWLRMFLNLDFPDTVIDSDSTGSPMDIFWEIYHAGVTRDPNYPRRVLVYASRDSYKTLSAAALEIMAMMHMNRSLVHMAAIESQSSKAQEYLKAFLDHDDLSEFKTGDNKRTVAVCWFEEKSTGDIYTLKEWETMGGRTLKGRFVRHVYYAKILVNTPQSANCVDPNTGTIKENGEVCMVRDLHIGDRIRSFDLSNRNMCDSISVVASVHKTYKQAMEITFDNGHSLVVSEDHPILTQNGWRRAKALTSLDRCLSAPIDATENNAPLNTIVTEDACYNVRSALIGTLIGDATLNWPKKDGKKYGAGPRFWVSHCKAQEEYLVRKQAIVESFGVDTVLLASGKGQKRVLSKVSNKWVELHDLFYATGRKAITPKLVSQIDEEALAFWFMDDGSGNSQAGLGYDRNVTFATCSFTIEEHQLLIDLFKDKWGLNAWIGKTSNGEKKYPVLTLDLESSRKLAHIIGQYVSPCLRYKLPREKMLLDNRCIDCDAKVPQAAISPGFLRCSDHSGEVSEYRRIELRKLRKMLTRKVIKVRYLGLAELCDVGVSSGPRNFYTAGGVLVHNSDHTAWMTVDELDLIRFPKAYKESLFIPGTQTDVYGRKQPPITLITSTRKSSGGLVQKEIDNADKTGLKVHHWNVLDVTAACPTDRHRPDLPKLVVWRSDDTLLSLTPEEYKELEAVDPKKATTYVEAEAYHGCMVNCKIFAACQGRLAAQKSESKMLKELSDTVGKFAENDLDMALAQLLCRKPGRSGSVYTTLNKLRHLLTPKDMWAVLTGDPPPKIVTKQMLIDELTRRESKVWGGMDFGFTHCFASTTGWQDGRRMFVLDAFEIPGLEPNQCVETCDKRIKKFDATIYPDTAYPAYIKMFRRNGYRMNTHDKDVHGGIEAVRRKLNPSGNAEPELFFLAGDEGCELLFKRLDEYKWMLDSQGNPTDQPDETGDDLPDALRYMVQNAFKGAKVTMAKNSPVPLPEQERQYTEQDWMSQKIQELSGASSGSVPLLIKKGSFVFDG